MLNHLKIAGKLGVLIAVGLAGTVILAAFSLYQLRTTMLEDRKVVIRQMVEAATNIADYYQKQAASGALTEDAAKEQAKIAIRAMRFGDGNYMFAYNSQVVTQLHGGDRAKEGVNKFNETDPAGTPFAREMVERALAGGGYTPYLSARGGNARTLPKISYSQYFKAWDWVIATGVYVDDINAAFVGHLLAMGGVIAAAVAAMTVFSMRLGRGIVRPIAEMTRAMGVMADGNLDISIPAAAATDEVGAMARAMTVFKDGLIRARQLTAEQEVERAAREARARAIESLTSEFSQHSSAALETVDRASVQLQATAQSMSATAEQTNHRVASVSLATQDASASVQTVSSAAEELAASSLEIGRQVEQSRQVALTASDEANRTRTTVQGLADSSAKIGAVVNLINDIASQTNLLALNATIEAARAGDAGKGFAVVAGEVKNLANQTARATEEISAQIGAVQTATEEAVNAIAGIVQRIDDINHITAAISTAAEQQSAATAEIARNVLQAAEGTDKISTNIEGVTQAAAETGSAANQVLASARSLAAEAAGLKAVVGQFLDGVRSA